MPKNPIKNAWGLHTLNGFVLFLILLRLPRQIFSTQKILYYMISKKGTSTVLHDKSIFVLILELGLCHSERTRKFHLYFRSNICKHTDTEKRKMVEKLYPS